MWEWKHKERGIPDKMAIDSRDINLKDCLQTNALKIESPI